MYLFCQVCGPPGMMNHISGDKAKDRSQGEVLWIYFVIYIITSDSKLRTLYSMFLN